MSHYYSSSSSSAYHYYSSSSHHYFSSSSSSSPYTLIYGEEPWYQQETTAETQFQGIFRLIESVAFYSGRTHQYYLEVSGSAHRYPVYSGGQTYWKLDPFVETVVTIEGKLLAMRLDMTRLEIWPGRVCKGFLS